MEAHDREFMREPLLRHQKATDLMFRRFDAGIEALRAPTREFVAESRAQREARVRTLDRLDGAGA